MTTLTYDSNYNVGYPVGDHIIAALECMKEAAKKFNELSEYANQNIKLFCRGSSGAILAAAFVAGLPTRRIATIIHVKKNGEDSHGLSRQFIEVDDCIIIIDDFIATGNTIRNIYKAVPRAFRVNCLVLVNCIYEETDLYSICDFIPTYLITRHIDP